MNRVRTLRVIESTPAEANPADLLEFDWVYRRYASYVAAVAHRLLGRDPEVDDTVQEVFLVAIRGLSGVRDPNAVKSWLASIAVRVARRKLRLRRMRAFLFGTLDPSLRPGLGGPVASPEHHALLKRVGHMLDSLPANHRIAWTLRHVQDERLESVATLCGCSLATAKRWIAAAEQAIEDGFSDV